MSKKRGNFSNEYKLISVWPSTKDKTEYETWSGHTEVRLLDWLQSFADQGWKITISKDAQQSCELVSATCKTKGCACTNTVFMFRHTDLDKAVAFARWYCDIVLDWGNSKPASGEVTDW